MITNHYIRVIVLTMAIMAMMAMMLALNVNNNMAQVPQESASKPRPFYGGNESQMPGTVRRLHCLNPVEPLTETIQVYPSWTLNTFTKAATTSLWTMATCHGDAALLSWTFSTFGELGTGRRNLSVRSTNSLGLCTSMCILNHLYPCYPKVAIISITTLQCLPGVTTTF